VDVVVPKSSISRLAEDGCEAFKRGADGEFPKLVNDRVKLISLLGMLNNATELRVKEGQPGEPREPEVSADINGNGTRDWKELWQAIGSPTEVVIMRACVDIAGGPANLEIERANNFNVFSIPFNSENKWMLTVHQDSNDSSKYMTILKGAAEKVLTFCSLDGAAKAQIENEMQRLMSQGRRVLSIARRDLKGSDIPAGAKFEGSEAKDCNFPLTDFEFVGLYGIEDPPKQGVADAVVAAQDAGVKVVMVTGDHPDTARAIAGRINILDPDRQIEGDSSTAATFAVIKGTDLEKMVPTADNFTGDEPEKFRFFGGRQWNMPACSRVCPQFTSKLLCRLTSTSAIVERATLSQ